MRQESLRGFLLEAKPPAPGLVAPPVAVPATASAPDRLVALLGREPR
nr:hypothetical protein [Kibdelosporangium sp. MJ126-NF4]CEL18636.1 hypothetical protein [Kibdelosporangium sp. MJ126-NF4]